MVDSLDSIVKGAPAVIPSADRTKSVSGTSSIATSLPSTGKTGDPLSHTPCSPSMIYLNLLILEASLRAQYLELRARRRQHSFFLLLLALWISGFGYALFLAPREDGRGVGGSVYWMVETIERICFGGGVITAILVWTVGIWERGVRWPRRWHAITNRGLRGFNCKLVVMRRPWWRKTLSTLGWFLTYGLFTTTAGASFRFVDRVVLREVDRNLKLTSPNHRTLPISIEDEDRSGHEEDLSPGGDYVRLLLLPKPFSPTFRENWEIYRAEYWERENERRALLRAKIHELDRKLRKQQGGWFWWLPWRRVAVEKPHTSRGGDPEKAHHAPGHLHPHPRHVAVAVGHKRTSSGSVGRGSTSTNASRSPTPTPETDDGVSRRASTASDKKKRKLSAAASPMGWPRRASRAVTPDNPSPLAKQPGVNNELPQSGPKR